MDQTRYAKLPQEYCQDVQCAWSQSENPTTRRAGPEVSQESESSDLRTHTTTIRTTHDAEHCNHLASLQEINKSAARRAVKPQLQRCAARALAPEAPWASTHVSCAPGPGRASRSALGRSGQTCALLAGWPGALATAGARVALAHVFSQSPVHAQGSKSSQRPNAVPQNQHTIQ